MSRRYIIEKDFVSLTSIGNYCMVSRSTVRRWIKNGDLNAVMLPSGHYRVSINNLTEFLKRHGMPLPKKSLNSN